MTPALHDRDSRPTAITHQLGRPVTVIAVLVACTGAEGVPGTAQSPVDRQLDLTNTTVIAGDARRPLVGIADAAFIEGGVVIAERSSGRLQFYTQEGQLIRTAGGAGDGPGRFQRIGWVQPAGDRIVVYDEILNRASLFDGKGNFLSSNAFGQAFGRPVAIGQFTDGSFLVRRNVADESRSSSGRDRPHLLVQRYNAGAESGDSIGALPGSERYSGTTAFGNAVGTLPFGRTTALAVSNMSYFAVDNEGPAVLKYDSRGRLLARIDVLEVAHLGAVSAADRRAMRAVWSESNTARIDYGAMFDEIGTAAVMPYFGWAERKPISMLGANAAGWVWVLHYGGTRGITPRWTFVAPETGRQFSVASSETVSLLDFDGRHALILRWHGDGAETIEIVDLNLD